jgi:hypothetical protein
VDSCTSRTVITGIAGTPESSFRNGVSVNISIERG